MLRSTDKELRSCIRYKLEKLPSILRRQEESFGQFDGIPCRQISSLPRKIDLMPS